MRTSSQVQPPVFPGLARAAKGRFPRALYFRVHLADMAKATCLATQLSQARLQRWSTLPSVAHLSVRVPLAAALVTRPGEARSAAAPWASGLADLRTEVGLPGAFGPCQQKRASSGSQALPRHSDPRNPFDASHRLDTVAKPVLFCFLFFLKTPRFFFIARHAESGYCSFYMC